MILIVCVSPNGGIAFNKRRQSRDALLIEDMLKTVNAAGFYADPYSKTIFPEDAAIIYDESYQELAGEGDYCFYEKGVLGSDAEKIEGIIIYRWNRDYPADEYFNMPKGFLLKGTSEFAGKSHPKITKEVWRRES